MSRLFLAPLLAGAILASSGLPAAHAQETVQVHIDAIDTSAYPQLRATVTVIDSGGRPIADLPAGAFSADADGEAVPVVSVASGLDADVPADVVLTFDSSGSMQGAAIEQAREAGKALVSELGPNDRVSVIKFGETVQVVQGFTNDRSALTAAIDGIQADGNTALYDSVVAAVQTAQGGAQRRAVVLLSDGLDFGGVSKNDRGGSLAAAQTAGGPFFVIGLGGSIDQAYLQELANVSRGQLFLAPSPSALQGLYETIGTALRSQYILELDGVSLGAGTPTLQVSVNDAARSGAGQIALDLTAFAPTPPPTVVSTPPVSTPVVTVAPTPVTPPVQDENGTPLLLPLGLAAAAVLAAGGTAGTAFWLSRRRQAAEQPVMREPDGLGPSRPVFTGNEPVFVGSGPMDAVDAAAWLEVVTPDRPARFPLGEDPITVGFSADCTICLPAGAVQDGARVRLWRREGRYMLHNLSRLGRVTVGGKPVIWAVLEDGDEILLGSYLVVFHDSSAVAEEPAANH